MNCPSCGQEKRENARFCEVCGTNLVTSQEQEDATPLRDDFVPSTSFVGRRRELGELKSALEDALSGQSTYP